MGLPKLNENVSYIKTKLPSGKSIGLTGWYVKEEKDLLFAIEVDENPEENKINLIINMLKQCVDDKSKYDSLSENDLVKIAIEARKLSKGETIEYNGSCINSDGTGCGYKFEDEVNLSQEQVTKQFDISPLEINSRLTLTFKDLEWITVEKLYKECKTDTMFSLKCLIHSIDSITLDGTTYTEFTPEDAENFIDELKVNDLKKLHAGFESRRSQCTLERTIKCVKCGNEIKINFGDLLSFLVL